MASILPAVVVDFGTWLFSSSAAAVVTRTVIAVVVSRLVANRLGQGGSGGTGSGRIQFAPASDNKIPVVYGNAYMSGPITDAKISSDLKTMWFVIALAEVTDTTPGSYYTFGDVYYDGKLVTFGTDSLGNYTKVASLTINTNPAQVDTTQAGQIFVYLYPNGSTDLTHSNTTQTAIQILQDSGIPSGQQWTSDDTMTLCAFAIVKIYYNANAGTTGLGALTFQLTNTINSPGTALLDYMTNPRYGCGIPIMQINTASLTELDTFSAEQITYLKADHTGTATQNRYTVNGPLDTSQPCMTNIQYILDSCDSWIQFSEKNAQWSVVINKSYLHDSFSVTSMVIGNSYSISNLGTEDWNTIAGTTGVIYEIGSIFTCAVVPSTSSGGQVVNAPYLITDSNIVGGINLSPISLNDSYNQVEPAHPDHNVKDQTDYETYDLVTPGTQWYNPSLLNPNEPVNKLNLNLPLVNNVVQAGYIGVRRLYQSRIILTCTFRMDYSGIQIEAGDVVRINFAPYGWTNKLFRVQTTAEERDGNANLFTNLTLFEYSEDVYTDWEIQDIIYYFNNGLTNPMVIDPPSTPTTKIQINTTLANTTSNSVISSNNSSTQSTIQVSTVVPAQGTVTSMAINVGNTPNVAEHIQVATISPANGISFASNSTVTANIQNLPSGNYYFSATAYNPFVGRTGNSTSNAVTYSGTQVTNANVFTCNTATSNGNIITMSCDLGNNYLYWKGANLQLTYSNGSILSTNYLITNVITSNTFSVDPAPPVGFSGTLLINSGGITGNNIQYNTIIFENIGNTASVTSPLTNYSYETSNEFGNTVNTPINLNTFGDIGTSNYAHNKYLNSVYNGSDSGYLFPYYQGTSSTINGYHANSTGSLTPAFAAQLQVYNGDYNWYVLEFASISTPVTTGYEIIIKGDCTLVSNSNVTIQTLPFIQLNNTAVCVGKTDVGFNTYNLIADQPEYIQYTFSEIASSNITGAGVLIREMSSANVVALSGQFGLSQMKN